MRTRTSRRNQDRLWRSIGNELARAASDGVGVKVTARTTKQALIREPGYPIGVPAPLYIACECGEKVSDAGTARRTVCKCGIGYDRQGWIVMRPAMPS